MSNNIKIYDEEFFYDDEHPDVIARCAECGELIYDDNDDVYVDRDGQYFCKLKCALDYHGIGRTEDFS